MSKLVRFGFALLVANTLVVGWATWQRISLSRELDSTTSGTITVAESSGRGADRLVARYLVDGKQYTVQGSSSDKSSLNVNEHPLDSKITVYFNAADPSRAALARKAGYGVLLGTTILLVAVSLFAGLWLFSNRRTDSNARDAARANLNQ